MANQRLQLAGDAHESTMTSAGADEGVPRAAGVDGPFNTLGQARFLADDFLNRVNEIDFEDADLRQQAIYTGNLYAGLTRYVYAGYFGLEPENGGGVINNSPFIPSADMFDRALGFLEEALSNAISDYEARVANSLIGRIHVYQGNYGTALSFLEDGLEPGDAPLQSVHSLESQNAFSAQAGASRNQYTVASRYNDYIEADANEANRILLEILPEAEVTDAGVAAGVVIYRQTKYFEDTNINIVSWQENHLLLAEVELQEGGATGPANARTLIDEVRASHNIDPLPPSATVNIDLLLDERDKELYLTGNRMIDQRRYDNWHLPSGSWKYFPITQSERNNNPEL